MTSTVWLPALLLFVAAAFGTLALVLLLEIVREWWEQRAVRRQLGELMGSKDVDGRNPTRHTRDGLIRQSSGDSEEKWAATLRSLPGVRGSLSLLEEADTDWSPWTFFLLMVGASVALGGTSMILTGSVFLSLLPAALGATLPYLYLNHRRKRKNREFESGFPEALELLTRAVRAGHPLTAGLRMVGAEGPEPVAAEFRTTSEEHRFGLPIDDALLGMVDRVSLVDVRIFVTAVLIQRESGGNLAEILDNLGSTIRDRFMIRRQLRVYTAQGRLSGYTLAALPPVVGLGMYMLEPAYVSMLFTETLGRLLLGTAFVLQILGYLWIRKIVNIEI